MFACFFTYSCKMSETEINIKEISCYIFKTYLEGISPFMGPVIPLILTCADDYIMFQSQGASLCLNISSHMQDTGGFLRFTSECNTCSPLGGKYCRLISFPYIPYLCTNRCIFCSIKKGIF